jgi:hypothetical protein
MKKNLPNENGQTLIEFALVLGLLMFTFLVFTELLDLERQRSDIDKVARQATMQAASYGGETPELEAYMNTELQRIGRPNATWSVSAYDMGSSATFTEVSPATNVCRYGGHIGVTVADEWETFIPTMLFSPGIDAAGVIERTHIARCWWGQVE